MILQRRVLWAGTVRTKSLAERIEAAKAGRFTHMTFFPSDLQQWIDGGTSLGDIRRQLEDGGIAVLAIDPFGQWVPDFAFQADYPAFLRDHFDYDEDTIFRMADGVGALEVNLVEPMRGEWRRSYSSEALADAFGAFADRAAARGFATTLEFMPISGIPDLATAWAIVDRAARPDTGICFDTWHFARSGSSLDLLRQLPAWAITEVQLADAMAEPVGDLIEDLLRHRMLPGAGELGVAQIVDALKAIGAYRSVGPEIFATAFDAMDARTAGLLAGDSLDRMS